MKIVKLIPFHYHLYHVNKLLTTPFLHMTDNKKIIFIYICENKCTKRKKKRKRKTSHFVDKNMKIMQK